MRACLGLNIEGLKEIIRDKPSIAKRLVRGVIPETAVRVLEEMQNRGVEIFSSCPTPLPMGNVLTITKRVKGLIRMISGGPRRNLE